MPTLWNREASWDWINSQWSGRKTRLLDPFTWCQQEQRHHPGKRNITSPSPPRSATIREASYYSRWELTDPQVDTRRVRPEHSVLSGMSPSQSAPQGSGRYAKRWRSQRGRRSPRKQCCPDNRTDAHTNSDWGSMYRACKGSSEMGSRCWGWSGHRFPPLTKTTCKPAGNRKIKFSPTESHWVWYFCTFCLIWGHFFFFLSYWPFAQMLCFALLWVCEFVGILERERALS